MSSYQPKHRGQVEQLIKRNTRLAKRYWSITAEQLTRLKALTSELEVSVAGGDLQLIEGRWYVTHAGLLHIATNNRCGGMNVQPVRAFCNPEAGRWAFKATVYKYGA